MTPATNTDMEYRIRRSKEAREEAKIALNDNRILLAANSIYYSMYYIVSALALKNSFVTSSHRKLLSWFNKNFIHSKILPGKICKIYSKAFYVRQERDLEEMVEYPREKIEQKFNDMILFVETVEKLISNE